MKVRNGLRLNVAETALGGVYHSPDAPLHFKTAPDQRLGEYGDGYAFDSTEEKCTGSEYGIRMNERGITASNEKLIGDDPKIAFETYAHEFRHSYQAEQVHAFERGLKTDHFENARQWTENFKNYESPPAPELARTDPERYFKEYEAYRNQPVERDARKFASDLSSKIYGDGNAKF